ncbi:CoA transferase [Bradyrhizobium sp. 195]|nr:CoA transferase [Bradyrhizobium sp. 195]UPK29928.1 CoA transferase [Bradyrhizobium sp. 195]
MSGPLDGIRILDLTTVILGPYATQILADMGADVVKVETPEGDSTRYTGPGRSADMAALFMGVNRNKRSIVLNLKKPEALEALYALIDQADVLVHNMRPQKATKLGLSSDRILARNPKIVFAGLYGYREGGAYSGRPAYDDVIQAQCGLASLMADADGRPKFAPTVIADKTCALAGAYSILAALLKRERTGKGGIVEMPMFETMASFVLVEHLYGKMFQDEDWHSGYTRLLNPWRRPHETKDGYIAVMAYSDVQWRRF